MGAKNKGKGGGNNDDSGKGGKGGGGLKPATAINVRHILVRAYILHRSEYERD